jgi:hypothetical protein
VASARDVDFGSWQHQRVICDHEQHHQARDHVIIHGNTRDTPSAHFELRRVWGSLGCTLDALDSSIAQSLLQIDVPDQIGNAEAWYNCSSNLTVSWGRHCYARCTGRYQQSDFLGLRLHAAVNEAGRA